MRRLLGWILFFVGILVLAWWGRNQHARNMEATVTTGTETAATELVEKFPNAGLVTRVSGRDIEVEGAASADDRAEIVNRLVEVDGRRVVRDRIAILNTQSPYTLDATFSGDGKADMTGFATSAEMIDAYKGALTGANGENIDIAVGAPEGWQDAAVGSLGALTKLKNGVLSMKDLSITIKGDADSEEARDQILASLKDLPSGFQLDANITAPEPAPEPEPEPEPVVVAPDTSAACASEVEAILAETKINFELASAQLAQDAGAVLDRLAAAIIPCLEGGEYTLEIGGHTDSMGTDENNMALSEARAKSVMDALAARSVPQTGMTARGYGETQPIDSNDTVEGRAANRRTTMTWIKKQ